MNIEVNNKYDVGDVIVLNNETYKVLIVDIHTTLSKKIINTTTSYYCENTNDNLDLRKIYESDINN